MEKIGNNLLGKTVQVSKVQRNVVKRPNKNDCWNVALAFACNLEYETVRNSFKKRGLIHRGGAVSKWFTREYLENHGYKQVHLGYKSVRTMADDTKYTNYEYVVSVRGHVLYVRYGVVYDTESDLNRIKAIYRRKISSRRKSKYDFVPKEVN